MVMVDLGIPPGFDLLSEDLDAFREKTANQKSGRLEKFTLTPTQAILYFNAIAAERQNLAALPVTREVSHPSPYLCLKSVRVLRPRGEFIRASRAARSPKALSLRMGLSVRCDVCRASRSIQGCPHPGRFVKAEKHGARRDPAILNIQAGRCEGLRNAQRRSGKHRGSGRQNGNCNIPPGPPAQSPLLFLVYDVRVSD